MSKIFNNIEDVESYLGVPLSSPTDVPDDANIICYDVDIIGGVTFYKESKDGLYYKSDSESIWWQSGSDTLEEEVLWDSGNGYNFAYLRLDQKDAFTPDCLVGVETDRGYISHIVVYENFLNMGETQYYAYTTESLSKEDLIDVHTLKYYISDESDETVSFTDYVNMFYDGWYDENEIKP